MMWMGKERKGKERKGKERSRGGGIRPLLHAIVAYGSEPDAAELIIFHPLSHSHWKPPSNQIAPSACATNTMTSAGMLDFWRPSLTSTHIA
jgi:hypothetical protein